MRIEVVPAGRAGRPEAVAPPASGSRVVLFQALLEALCESGSGDVFDAASEAASPSSCQAPDRLLVQPGDCLSVLCAEQLRKQGGAASRKDVLAAVQEVARANQIADPDRIYAGRTLDVSGLAEAGKAGVAENAESAQSWAPLVQGPVRLSSGFGPRKDPFSGQLRQHNGIDVAAPAGSPITAFRPGSVVFSGWKPGYGNTVIVRHEDGLESLYGHLSKSLVQAGERVGENSTIACVGSTGRSTGAHLHFEVRRDGKAVDPMPLLKGNLSGFA